MKKKKIVTIGLAVLMVCSSVSLIGCGGKSKKSGGEKVIEIAYWNSGLGAKWLEAEIAAFEAKYPEYEVKYTATASETAVVAGFRQEDTDTTDLYMALKQYDTDYLEPLDDVLDSKAEGDSKTLREKIDPSYLKLEETADGKVNQLTYGGGALGFVYNKEQFQKAGITTLPRTTDELAIACDQLLEEDITPICHFAGGGYWRFMAEAWFMQYEGLDYYLNHFYACKDENGNSPSKEVFTKEDGRYAVVKACEKIITPDSVLLGSNTNDHVTAQTMFLQGEAAIMINGAWLSNEMSSAGDTDNFEVMKTPVISTIIDKLTSVKKESDLRKLITAIDAVTDGEKDISDYKDGENYNVDGLSVTAADWDYVSNARNTTPGNFSGEDMYIPNYSDAKEGAKKFIAFLYSDEGYRIYTEQTHMTLPLNLCEGEIDSSKWNSFEKSFLDLQNKTQQTATEYIMSKHKIFAEGGAASFANYSFYDKLCSNNVSDRMNSSQIWDEIIKKVDGNYENNWIANISE